MQISAINYGSGALYVKGANTRERRNITGRVRVQGRRELLFSTLAAVELSDSRTELLNSKLNYLFCVYSRVSPLLLSFDLWVRVFSSSKTLETLFVRVFKEIWREQGEKWQGGQHFWVHLHFQETIFWGHLSDFCFMQRLESYYKRNYKDYFGVIEGTLRQKVQNKEQLTESEQRILEWLDKNK